MGQIEPYKGIARIYEEIRPSYPDQLILDIISGTKLKTNHILLEIGAGTGKATLPFADKGFQIHAVEIGAEMAEILREKCAAYSKVTIEISSFEEWNGRDDLKYDMIYSAQAFHWIDKNIKYNKCYDLLKEDGYLTLFWYQPTGRRSRERMELEEQVDRIVKHYITEYSTNYEKPSRIAHTGVSDKEARRKELEESGLFRILHEKEYTYEVVNSPEQYLKAMKSVPAYTSLLDGLEPEVVMKLDQEIQELIIKHGGCVKEEFDYSLYIAQKFN